MKEILLIFPSMAVAIVCCVYLFLYAKSDKIKFLHIELFWFALLVFFDILGATLTNNSSDKAMLLSNAVIFGFVNALEFGKLWIDKQP